MKGAKAELDWAGRDGPLAVAVVVAGVVALVGQGLDVTKRALRCARKPVPIGFQAATNPLQSARGLVFRRQPCPATLRLIRYRFDSSKAPKTVRWRRFWGFEFALKKGVKGAKAGLHGMGIGPWLDWGAIE